MTLISRKDQGLLARWWFSVDWPPVGAVFLLMALGVIFSLAASPPVAERIGLDGFHFFRKHLIFLLPAAGIFVAATFLSGRQTRRLALMVFIGGLALMVAALLVGPQIKGAHRWISLGIGSFLIQPSEFVKPAFIVLAAWLLAEGQKRPDMPGIWLAWGSYLVFAGLLVKQPDMGQTALVTGAWGILLVLFGLRWKYLFALGGAVVALAGVAWAVFPHVRARVDRFIHPPQLPDGARDQMDFALDAFHNGGLLGMGPGGGLANRHLPDAHTDFLFAAVGEEFGLVACLGLVGLFSFIVLRGMSRAAMSRDPFRRLAASGLFGLFGLQAFINMGVNVQLLPAKGMTLPLISYGGSSLISAALGLGMALALLRRDAIEEAREHSAGAAMPMAA